MLILSKLLTRALLVIGMILISPINVYARKPIVGNDRLLLLLGKTCDPVKLTNICDSLLYCNSELKTCQLVKKYTSTDRSKKIKTNPPNVAAALMASRRTGDSWDFQVEVGIRVLPNRMRCFKKKCLSRDLTPVRYGWPIKQFDWGDMNPKFPMFGRLQLGWLWLREPWVFTMGVTTTYGGLGNFGLGVITEITNIWQGMWGQFESAWVFGRGVQFSVAGGFTLIGVEWKFSPNKSDHAVLIKLRIPIGLVRYVKSNF